MWRRISLFCLGLLALVISHQASVAQGYERRWHHEKDKWQLLGRQSVGFGVDRDVIKVGAHDGQFKSLVLVVRENDIYLHKVEVVFGNGDRQVMRIEDTLRDGERTRALDLEGKARVISQIEMLYRSRPSFKGKAVVEVYGEHPGRHAAGPPHGHAGQWVDLGCQKVGFFGDRDTIKLPSREDRYRAVRIMARGTTINLRRVRVHFRTGAAFDVARPQKIHSGGFSDRMDLPGDGPRRVTRIDLEYASKLSFKGQATACVQGQQ